MLLCCYVEGTCCEREEVLVSLEAMVGPKVKETLSVKGGMQTERV